jgi:ubiquinone biosynthesis protein UbiJ
MDVAIKGEIVLIGEVTALLTPLIKKDIADFLSRTHGQVQRDQTEHPVTSLHPAWVIAT